VRFYNDSIATIPESAIAALVSFPPRRVIQIVGGYDHHLPIAEMCAVLNERAKAVLCIGATGDQVAGRLGECSHSDAAAVHRCGDLSAAMQIARKIAVPGDVVLLSTGYKSFDQFANFERRGEAFVKLVRDISL
jgi:UDP-N-acetylmuramoylalanine--D-glutamate ligase